MLESASAVAFRRHQHAAPRSPPRVGPAGNRRTRGCAGVAAVGADGGLAGRTRSRSRGSAAVRLGGASHTLMLTHICVQSRNHSLSRTCGALQLGSGGGPDSTACTCPHQVVPACAAHADVMQSGFRLQVADAPSPSLLIHLLKVKGGGNRMTHSPSRSTSSSSLQVPLAAALAGFQNLLHSPLSHPGLSVFQSDSA